MSDHERTGAGCSCGWRWPEAIRVHDAQAADRMHGEHLRSLGRDVELTEFITARLDDLALDASGLHDIGLCDRATRGLADPGFGWECTCHNPARVLAAVEAHRKIVAQVIEIRGQGYAPGGTARLSLNYSLDSILRALASIWADHPDFDPAWEA